MDSSGALLYSPEFLRLVRRLWKDALLPEALSEEDLPDGFSREEVWEALLALRRAQAFCSPRNMRTSTGIVSDWHTVTEHLNRVLLELDHKTRWGSKLDRMAGARDGRAFVTQQYIEEIICNLRFDGYEADYEDVRAVLRGERSALTDGERIAVNFHELMRELPAIAENSSFDVTTLESFYTRLLEGVEREGTLGDNYGAQRGLPRSPLEEHYVEVVTPGEIDRASLQMPVDVANGVGSDPRRHPIMESMLVNCQFWRAALFPSCNNMMGCIASRFYLVREGYPVFRYIPKIRVLEKWKQGSYRGVEKFTYDEALRQVDRDKDWTFYYETVMALMLREVESMERSLGRRAVLDDEALDLVERIPYLSHRQREVLRRAILVPGAEFTIAGQKERYGVVYSTARADLEDLVKRGLLDRTKKGQAFVYVASAGINENLSVQQVLSL